MALETIARPKTNTDRTEQASLTEGRIGNRPNGAELKDATTSSLGSSQKITDFLLDQINNKNIDPQEAKVYHQILRSPEFQVALKDLDHRGQSLSTTIEKLLDSRTRLNPELVKEYQTKGQTREQATETIKTEILKDILNKVHTNAFTNQGTKNTCVLSTNEAAAFNKNPAETCRMVTELAINGHYKITRGKETLEMTLPIEHINKDTPNERFAKRNLFENIVQESLAEALVAKVGGIGYSSEQTSWSLNGVELTGFYAAQGQYAHYMLTGERSNLLSKDTHPEQIISQTVQSLKESQASSQYPNGRVLKINANGDVDGVNYDNGVTVHLDWAPNGSSHAKHCLRALGICEDNNGNKFVILQNSHYNKGFGPNEITECNKKSPPHERLELIPLASFEKRLIEAQITSEQATLVTSKEMSGIVNNAVANCEQGSYIRLNDSIMLTIPPEFFKPKEKTIFNTDDRNYTKLNLGESGRKTDEEEEQKIAKNATLKREESLQELQARLQVGRHDEKKSVAVSYDLTGPMIVKALYENENRTVPYFYGGIQVNHKKS